MKEKLEKIINHYGYNHQKIKLVEECAKIKRAIENVREELLLQADEIDNQLKALCRLESKLLDTAPKTEQNKTEDAAEC